MTLREFEKLVQEKLQHLYPEASIEFNNIKKNNDTIKKGLFIRKEAGTLEEIPPQGLVSLVPVYYLEEVYDKQMTMEDVNEVVSIIYSKNEEYILEQEQKETLLMLNDFEKISKKISFYMINTKRNKKQLREIPSRAYLDMSVVYRISMVRDSKECASILINNKLLKKWKVTEEDLWEVANKNTPILFPVMKNGMNTIMSVHVLKEILGDAYDNYKDILEEVVSGKERIIVVSNIFNNLGAAVILYKGLLNTLYKEVGHSFYIAMSSIHEFMVFMDEDLIPENQREIIRDINSKQGIKEEILSDSLYFYDGEKKELKIVE